MRIRIALGLFFAITLGCDSPTKRSHPDASASSAAARPSGSTAAAGASSCDKQVVELEQWTATLLAEGDPVIFAPNLKMPEVDQKPNGLYFNAPSFVSITDSMLLVDGKPAGSPRDITDLVKKFDELSSELQKKDKAGDVVIAASAETRWAVIASAAATAETAGFESVVFAFRARQALPEPKSDFLPKAVDPSQKAPLLDKDGGSEDKVFGQCPEASAALKKAVDPNAVVTPKQVVEQFIKVLPGALRACQCNVNMENVRATMWTRVRGVGEPAAYTVRVLLAKQDDQKATELSDKADAAWSSTHKKIVLLAGSKDRHRLAIQK